MHVYVSSDNMQPDICRTRTAVGIARDRTYQGQAKLIHSLSSGIFENHMQVGVHFHFSLHEINVL